DRATLLLFQPSPMPIVPRLSIRTAIFASAALFVVVSPPVALAQSQAPAVRKLTVDDIFAIADIKETALSPDGQWIAAVVTRPQTANEIYARDYMDGVSRADVWLIDRQTGERRNITRGLGDASGYWQPTWSPDGKRLALLSTKPEHGEPRGGDNA